MDKVEQTITTSIVNAAHQEKELRQEHLVAVLLPLGVLELLTSIYVPPARLFSLTLLRVKSFFPTINSQFLNKAHVFLYVLSSVLF